MKFCIVLSFILTVASAGIIHNAHRSNSIGAYGVPHESAENVAARAYHQAAHAEVTSFHYNAAAHAAPWSGDSNNKAGYDNSAWAAPVTTNDAHQLPKQWTGPQHLPIIGHNGVPVDTHDNNALRNFHHAAHAEAVTRSGDHGVGHSDVQQYSMQSTPISYGAHTETFKQWTGPQHYTVIGHNGVPVDTKENNALRTFHHAAHDEAASRNSGHASGQTGSQGYASHATGGVYGGHAESIQKWSGPQHLAIIGHNGVPVDTHENNARRTFHNAAYAKAAALNGHHGGARDYAGHAAPVASNNQAFSHGHQW